MDLFELLAKSRAGMTLSELSRKLNLPKSTAHGLIGALMDLGIYCLNAAHYISGEEPIEVQAMEYSTPGDPRFTEVEEQLNFNLRFPSGFSASCYTSYSMTRSAIE